MLTTIEGTYEDGQIVHWHETPPAKKKVKVLVTFLEEETERKQARRGGSMAGEVWMADDFNAPLNDLSDYM